MSRTIQFLSPDWTVEQKKHLQVFMDLDELLETLETASQLPVPFDCDIEAGGIYLSARLAVESLMDDLGILDNNAEDLELPEMFQRVMEFLNE